MTITFAWRGELDDRALEELHAEGFGHEPVDYAWSRQLEHSLGWACAWDREQLVGFVNVAWDGGAHAFVLDTVVAASHRGRGIGTRLVEMAKRHAREAGCEWLHVDYDPGLGHFYRDACGFPPVEAGALPLRA